MRKIVIAAGIVASMAVPAFAGILPLSFQLPPGETECKRGERRPTEMLVFVWPPVDGICWMRDQLKGRLDHLPPTAPLPPMPGAKIGG